MIDGLTPSTAISNLPYGRKRKRELGQECKESILELGKECKVLILKPGPWLSP